jgi:hypothetical protein
VKRDGTLETNGDDLDFADVPAGSTFLYRRPPSTHAELRPVWTSASDPLEAENPMFYRRKPPSAGLLAATLVASAIVGAVVGLLLI